MPSPKPQPRLVSAAELELAGGLPARAFDSLKKSGVVPEPARKAVRGGRPGWGADAISLFGVTGAIYDAVPSLLLAAKLAGPIVSAFVENVGRLPGQMQDLVRAAMKAGADVGEIESDDDYIAIRQMLASYPDIYESGRPHEGDIIVIIVGRRYVFSRVRRALRTLSPWGNPARPEMVWAVISGWGRGTSPDDVLVTRFEDTIARDEFPGEPSAEAGAAKEREAFAALDRATSRIEVNVSLAIRNGLDRIHDHRISKRSE